MPAPNLSVGTLLVLSIIHESSEPDESINELNPSHYACRIAYAKRKLSRWSPRHKPNGFRDFRRNSDGSNERYWVEISPSGFVRSLPIRNHAPQRHFAFISRRLTRMSASAHGLRLTSAAPAVSSSVTLPSEACRQFCAPTSSLTGNPGSSCSTTGALRVARTLRP